MDILHRRRNVVAQVAEELKTVTCATPPMEERRTKRKRKQHTIQTLEHNKTSKAESNNHIKTTNTKSRNISKCQYKSTHLDFRNPRSSKMLLLLLLLLYCSSAEVSHPSSSIPLNPPNSGFLYCLPLDKIHVSAFSLLANRIRIYATANENSA